MIDSLLVGLDEDHRAAAAIDAALALGAATGGRVEFLHAVPGFWGWTSLSDAVGGRVAATVLDAARETQRAYLRGKLADTLGGDEVDERLVVVLERPGDALLERAREPGADLIVLGEHGHGGVFDAGRTARAVVGASPCPVWAQRGSWRPIRRILAPISTLDDNRHSLDLAAFLARVLGARLTVQHSFAPPELAWPTPPDAAGSTAYVVEELEAAERREFERAVGGFRPEGVDVDADFAVGDPAERILRHEDVDLVCLGTHTHSRLVKTVLGSVAYAVLRDSDVPVVVCPLLS